MPFHVTDDTVFLSHGNKYMPSVECMYGTNATAFLLRYQLLLRTDLDTFVSPTFIKWWPTTTSIRGEQGYAISAAVRANLVNISVALGLRHSGLHDLGSSWYGPSIEVIGMARITVSVARYIHLAYFNNSVCKMPAKLRHTHKDFRKYTDLKCNGNWEMTWPEWYEGVTLLYAQDIAANHVWENSEWTAPGMLDWEASETSRSSVCVHGHIHAYHSPDLFSKFDFFSGKYDDYDLDRLDLSKIADYALYIACKANDKGKDGSGAAALANIGGSLASMCDANKPATRAMIVALRSIECRCLQLQWVFAGDVLDQGQEFVVQAPYCSEKFGSQSWLWTSHGRLISLQLCFDANEKLMPQCSVHTNKMLKALRGYLCLTSKRVARARTMPTKTSPAAQQQAHTLPGQDEEQGQFTESLSIERCAEDANNDDDDDGGHRQKWAFRNGQLRNTLTGSCVSIQTDTRVAKRGWPENVPDLMAPVIMQPCSGTDGGDGSPWNSFSVTKNDTWTFV